MADIYIYIYTPLHLSAFDVGPFLEKLRINARRLGRGPKLNQHSYDKHMRPRHCVNESDENLLWPISKKVRNNARHFGLRRNTNEEGDEKVYATRMLCKRLG